MLTKQEAAARLNIHEQTVARWAKYNLIISHAAYNDHYCLYEIPESRLPQKQCSRWNRLIDRAARAGKTQVIQNHQLKTKEL